MDTVWHILGLILLLATCAGGILVLVLGLPGTFVILGAALIYAWATGFQTVGWSTLGWLLGLALLGEALEFAAGMLGAARQRPSRKVVLLVFAGGLVGGVLGAPLLFGLGALIGALLGAFAGGVLGALWEGERRRKPWPRAGALCSVASPVSSPRWRLPWP